MLGTRGIWHKGWHALTTHPPAPSQRSKFTQDVWELYDLSRDRAEVHNVAAQNPESLEESGLWFDEAGKYNGLPSEDRGAIELFATPRPQSTKSTGTSTCTSLARRTCPNRCRSTIQGARSPSWQK